MRLSHLLLVLLLHADAAHGDDAPPEIVLHKYQPSFVVWFSESAAFDAEGRLREDVAAAHPYLKRHMQGNPNGRCEAFMIEPSTEHFLRDTTLADVATFSLMAISGRVVHLSRGFFHGFPGTLVGFRVTDRLALRAGGDPIRVERDDLRYTFIASAEFLTPEGAICSRPPRPITIPKLGDDILMFPYVAPIDAAEVMVAVDSSSHLVIERDGTRIFTPGNLAEDLRGLTLPEAMLRISRSRRAR